MKRASIILGWTSAIAVAAAAQTGTYSYGPISFTNETPFTCPQFSPATGYLHGITFELTNCVRCCEVICDNDSTNEVALDAGFSEPLHLVKRWWLWHNGTYGILANAGTNLTDVFAGTDDGDRLIPLMRDGGVDEISFPCSHANVCGALVKTNAQTLAEHTGYGSNAIYVCAPLFGYSYFSPDDLEMFRSNGTHSGELYVHYHYESTPLQPDIADLSISNGAVWLDIRNLSPGTSNTIQRCVDLPASNWTYAGALYCTGWQTNWTEAQSNESNCVFYRALSE